MRIQAKIFLFIFITSFSVFAIVIGFIAFNYKNYTIREANRMADTYADHAAKLIKNTLEKDLAVCQTLALGFRGYNKIPPERRDFVYEGVLRNVLDGHKEYLSVWMSWELRFIDPEYKWEYGRKRTVTLRDAGLIKVEVDTVELDGDSYGSAYYKSKQKVTDVLVDPYFYKYTKDEGGDSILETSIAKPIVINDEFAGLVGIDITLDRFQPIVDKMGPFKGSEVLLLSSNGEIISYHGKTKIEIRDSVTKAYPYFNEFDVFNKIKKGLGDSFEYIEDSTSLSSHITFAPIKMGNSENYWSVCLIVPTKEIEDEAISNFRYSLLIGFSGILLFTIITLVISTRLTRPLKQTTAILKDLDKGIIDVSKKLRPRSKDEIAEMARSLNNLMDTLNKTTEFAKKIGQGDFNAQYKALSDHDVLGNALVEMQKNLQVGQEQEEIRQLERKKLTWAQDGLTELGEVLRTSTDNFEDYLLSILSYILKYLQADQGAIFLLNDIDPKHPFLELKSAYAYDKKKALEAKLEIGESLVGRCFQEKETIYMTNIPEGYTFVSSGLGSHEPRCLFLMPLLFENEPFGVIEMASFRELADFEIEFLKNIGERVASSISVMEKNVQTKQLLEQYQVQSDELQSRERMLQENLKELQKIEEDAAKIAKESSGIVEALLNVGSITWYDPLGNITMIRDKNLKDLGLSEHELKGKNHSEFATEAKEDPKEYERFWNDLRAGKFRRRSFSKETTKGNIWISEIYTPVLDKNHKVEKIICIGLNITEQKRLEERLEKLYAEIERLKGGS